MFPFAYVPKSTKDDDEAVPATYPPPGSATLTVVAEEFALFLSAEWTIKARVNGTLLAESDFTSHRPSQATVNRWARAYIKRDKKRLMSLGVDFEKEYVETFGGIDRDL